MKIKFILATSLSIMLLNLVVMFLKVGFLGFGGGYAMLSVIFDESLKLGLTIEQLTDLNVLDVLIPGPIAINAATYVGYLYAGILGSVVATATVTLPSFIFVPVMSRYEEKIKNNIYLDTMLQYAKTAAVGLISGVGAIILLQNVFGISNMQEILKAEINWFLLILAILCWILHDKFKINPILLTLGAGVIGFIAYYII